MIRFFPGELCTCPGEGPLRREQIWTLPRDCSDELIDRTIGEVREVVPEGLAHLAAVSTPDSYLAALAPGYYLGRLDALCVFRRRDDVAECLERMERAPRAESAAERRSALRQAEVVLKAYEFLGEPPAPRWAAMVDETVATFTGKPSKADQARLARVVELRSASAL